jgi:hypothetical protein
LGCAHRFRPTYAGANVGHPSDSLLTRLRHKVQGAIAYGE